MRKAQNGDAIIATSIILQRQGTTWDDPLVTINSECVDSRDGSRYTPAGVEPDRVLVSDAVAKGIWTREEAEEVISKWTKLFEGLGNDGIHQSI